uniref:Uncharacterized protein n=1 Tax=uncultured Desulfobacterium sp. TaxID=201089 RepID=E1YG24_9BACT|nr:unknown protein [uncultured Desulfobacterium sp.]
MLFPLIFHIKDRNKKSVCGAAGMTGMTDLEALQLALRIQQSWS